MDVETVALNHQVLGPEDAPAIFLGASLGTTLGMWDGLAESLATTHRVVRFDTRGHGGSPTPPGPYTMSELGADVVALADSLGIAELSYVGLSLGGAIGTTLALEHPTRLRDLVLCCTAPVFGDAATWRERSARVTAEGMGWLVEVTGERWFTPELLESRPEETGRILGMLGASSPLGYAACCDAIAGYDVSDRLEEIKTPTRVIAGAADPVTPPEVCTLLSDGIPGADLVVLDDAAHIANVARPDAFAAAVREHLT